jgi:hypothetical protein
VFDGAVESGERIAHARSNVRERGTSPAGFAGSPFSVADA